MSEMGRVTLTAVQDNMVLRRILVVVVHGALEHGTVYEPSMPLVAA